MPRNRNVRPEKRVALPDEINPSRGILPGYKWGLLDEKHFLKFLGSFRPHCSVDRQALLARYINAAERRQEWGLIDKSAVIEFAKQQLSEG
jgi:hypothetical protein